MEPIVCDDNRGTYNKLSSLFARKSSETLANKQTGPFNNSPTSPQITVPLINYPLVCFKWGEEEEEVCKIIKESPGDLDLRQIIISP